VAQARTAAINFDSGAFYSVHRFSFLRNTLYTIICLMIKALIFDLDSCLAAADEAGEDLFAPAFQAIRLANHDEVSEEQLRAAFKDCWRFPFDSIAEKYGFSSAMRAAGFTAFRNIEVYQRLHGYGDLHELAQLPAKLILVTSGFRRLQESKVKALGIAHLFTAIHIDAIDEGKGAGKLPVFASILQEHAFQPDEVLVVGDNPDSELAAGNQLGMTTIQTLRTGVPPSSAATHRIQTLSELKRFF
jgi:putative hydrolase of the HAD superfamily